MKGCQLVQESTDIMLKNAIAFFLLFIIGWNVSQEAFFLLWYRVANASFTERYCINVEEPELMCHGKCQIQKVSEQKKEAPNHNIPGLVLRFSYMAVLPAQAFPQFYNLLVDSASFHFRWDYDFLAIQTLFRPPPKTTVLLFI